MHRASDASSAARPLPAGPPAGARPSIGRFVDTQLPRTVLAALVVALAYGATARLGAALILPGARVPALWLPNAILLATLLLAPRRDWWIYLAAVLPAHFLALLPLGITPLHALVGYIGDCATALLAALALSAFVPGIRRIDCVRTAVAFVLLAALLAPCCTSLLVAATALATDVHTRFWWMAGARSLTNAFAILTVVPLVLSGAAWLREGKAAISASSAAEAALLGITLATLGILTFVAPDNELSPAMLYGSFGILLWGRRALGCQAPALP